MTSHPHRPRADSLQQPQSSAGADWPDQTDEVFRTGGHDAHADGLAVRALLAGVSKSTIRRRLLFYGVRMIDEIRLSHNMVCGQSTQIFSNKKTINTNIFK